MDQKNMHMKFSASNIDSNIDFSSPSPDPLGSRRSAHASVKGYPFKKCLFTNIGSSNVKTIANMHRHAAYHNMHWWVEISFLAVLTSVTLNDIEPPKYCVLVFFEIFCCTWCTVQGWIATKYLETDQDNALPWTAKAVTHLMSFARITCMLLLCWVVWFACCCRIVYHIISHLEFILWKTMGAFQCQYIGNGKLKDYRQC